MPSLIRSTDGVFALAADPFNAVADEQEVPAGDVIISLTRFQAEGEGLLSQGRRVGVRLASHEEVEALATEIGGTHAALVAHEVGEGPRLVRSGSGTGHGHVTATP